MEPVEFVPKTGPVKWCRKCARKHEARASCNLVAVERTLKSGRKATRYVHIERA